MVSWSHSPIFWSQPSPGLSVGLFVLFSGRPAATLTRNGINTAMTSVSYYLRLNVQSCYIPTYTYGGGGEISFKKEKRWSQNFGYHVNGRMRCREIWKAMHWSHELAIFFTRYKKFMICPSFVLDRKCGVHAFTLLLLTCGRLEYLHLTELKCFRCVLITHLYIHCYSPQRVCAFEIFCFSRVLGSDRASSEIQRCNKKI